MSRKESGKNGVVDKNNTSNVKADYNKTKEPVETEVIRFGDLKPGDYILDEENNPVEVLTVTEKHYPARMFEIGDGQGNSIKASGNHMWYVVTDIDRAMHAERVKEAKKVLAPLLNKKHNSVVKNRLVSFAENVYREDFPLEIPTVDMVALLYNDNNVDMSNPDVNRVFHVVQRISDSVGVVSEQNTTLQDYAFVDEKEEFKEKFYDARLLAQQILSLAAERKWRKKYPIRVGKVITTVEMLELMESGHEVYIPS